VAPTLPYQRDQAIKLTNRDQVTARCRRTSVAGDTNHGISLRGIIPETIVNRRITKECVRRRQGLKDLCSRR